MIIFKEDGHIYSYKGTILQSATTFINTFKPEFDEDFQIECMAIKRILGEDQYRTLVRGILGRSWNLSPDIPKMMSKLVDKGELSAIKGHIKEEWELAASKGTEFHKILENKFYEEKTRINVFTGKEFPVVPVEKQYDNQSLNTNLFLLEDGYYSELLVWDNTEAGKYLDETGNITNQEKYDEAMRNTIPGQVDEVWITTIDGIRYIDTNDHKTNAKPPSEFKGTKRHPADTYYPPFDHLFDNKITSYNLQGNLYQYLLSTFGFVRRHCAFTHYEDYDFEKPTVYEIPDMSEEIQKMLSKK